MSITTEDLFAASAMQVVAAEISIHETEEIAERAWDLVDKMLALREQRIEERNHIEETADVQL